eukprot:7386503-Prymnesium_polylepis.1
MAPAARPAWSVVGASTRTSVMERRMQSISSRLWWSRLASSGALACCSARSSASASGCDRSIAPSHVAVIDDACCPAKRSTISQPVTSESVKPVFSPTPSSHVNARSFWSKSSSTTSPERRAAMTLDKSCTISSRAASRCLHGGSRGECGHGERAPRPANRL